MTDTLTLLQWNCYVGNRVRRVRWALKAWIRLFSPDVIVLSEAGKFRAMLDSLEGYQLYQEDAHPEWIKGMKNDAGDVAILVREDVPVLSHRVARYRLRWRVIRHNRVHTPKRAEVVTIRHGRRRVKIRGEHPATHGFSGPNKAAFLEFATRAKAWALTRRGRPVVLIVGDLNETLARLAKWFGKRFKVAGHHIDALLGLRVKTIRHRRLTKGGGDHYANLFTITLDR